MLSEMLLLRAPSIASLVTCDECGQPIAVGVKEMARYHVDRSAAVDSDFGADVHVGRRR